MSSSPDATSQAASIETMPWWKKTVVYEVYPKSFQSTTGEATGDIAGITSRLDYLRELGVGAIWVTPVFVSPMADNGYDVADYRDIDPSFGTMADMEDLIAQADERGIKIVLDMVVNHTSNQNPWFVESSSSRDNPRADWYVWRDPAPDGGVPNNWRGIFGGSAWTWCEARGQYYLHTFLAEQPDLNWECEEVRREVADVFRFWMDKGAGGFRVDAVTYIKKPAGLPDGEPDATGMSPVHDATANTPGILDFLHELRDATVAGTDCFMVGEANGVPACELPEWVGERGVFDMLFEFSHQEIGFDRFWVEFFDWKLTDLKQALSDSQANTAQSGWYPIFFENHDQPRCVNQYFPKGADRELAAKALATVQFGQRGTPFLYQGQELGLDNVAWPSIDCYNDVSSINQYHIALDLGYSEEEALAGVHASSRDNARTPMQWDSSPHAGFTTGGATWLPVHDDYAEQNAEVESADPASVLNFFRGLAKLRRESDVLLCGDYAEVAHASEQIYAFVRTLGERRMLVVANLSLQEAELGEAGELLGDGACLLSYNYPDEPKTGAPLRPLEALIYELA